MIIFEDLNLSSFFYFIIINLKQKSKFKNVYYIYYNNNLYFKIIKFLFKTLKIKLILVNFKMMDIREKNGEITRIYLPRVIFFSLSKVLEKLLEDKVLDEKFQYYFIKNFFTSTHLEKYSAFRTLFIMHTIKHIYDKKNYVVFLNSRPFFKLYSQYAKNLDIQLMQSKNKIFILVDIFSLMIRQLYFFLQYFKRILFYNKSYEYKNDLNKVYCESSYQPNLLPNGFKSDFFWLFDSSFNKQQVLYNCGTNNQVEELTKEGINTSLHFSFKPKFFNAFKINPFNFNKEYSYISSVKFKYSQLYTHWFNYFKFYNVKLTLNWHKYNSDHIPLVNAINDLNGMSCFYQFAFEGYPQFESKVRADISFNTHKFMVDMNKRNQCNFNFEIITGHPQYKITDELKNKSKLIRNNLLREGAEKIICVFDENSTDDSRWHTGNELQSENYETILLELLNNKKLGIIFKPKNYVSLRERLGDVSRLLEEGIRTKRCYVFTELNEGKIKTTKALPLLAALSSDLVIHSHLCAGTAGIETALKKIPTIFIDREKSINSVLYNVLNKNLIYNNWSEALEAIRTNVLTNNNNSNFGLWGESLEFFDPFGDDNGGLRIGNFMSDLLDGYNELSTKDKIIDLAITNYKKKWGNDKVIIN